MKSELIFGTFSKGLVGRKLLPAAVEGRIVKLGKTGGSRDLKGILGWGRKDNTEKARKYARRLQLPYLSIEDGFVRSIGLGVHGAQPFGFIIDRTGIYYDATRPSDLENIIRTASASDKRVVRKLIDRIVTEQVYKYNCNWDNIELPNDGRPKVLLIDQTVGDMSIRYGQADATSFVKMVAAAKARYPEGAFYIKAHPDVIAGKKQGYLTKALSSGFSVISEDCNPHRLFRQVDHVFTVTSQMGFEALLSGKKVSCFGMPFYAGWGLTEDQVQCSRRGMNRTLEDLFEAAYLRYVRYVDPVTERRCDLERIIDRIVTHRRTANKNRGKIFCFGFRIWKRGIIRRFIGAAQTEIRFVNSISRARKLGIDHSSRIVVWGLGRNPDAVRLAREYGIRIERIEDGFIRSVGLGSDFAKPSSLIVDRTGIYLDPRSPSDLELLLNSVQPSPEDLQEARQVRRTIVALGMSKYNTGRQENLSLTPADGRPVLLVPGQVEDDASITVGCKDIRTNLQLLQEVRRSHPDAFIIYKPHPDVLAKNRRGAVPFEVIQTYCDLIVNDRNISSLLAQVDQVHTMTSLTGFEALLRHKVVHTYGLPFYAGWGLTTDRHAISRRQRRLTIDELVYCCLILYPRYYNWSAHCFVGVADTLENLRQTLGNHQTAISISYARRLVRKTTYLLQNIAESLGRQHYN